MTSFAFTRGFLGERRWWGLALGLGALAALAGTLLQSALAGSALERVVADLYVRLRPRDAARAASLDRVVVVEIDDRSISPRQLGRFSSWPRTHLAEVVSYLDRAGAASIGLDLLIPEPDPVFPQDDARLVGAVRRSGRTALAACARIRPVSHGDPVERLEPFPALAAAAARLGLVNLFGGRGTSRSARRYPFTPDWEGAAHDSLATALVALARGEAPAWPPSPLDYPDPVTEGQVATRSFVDVLEEARQHAELERRVTDPRPFSAGDRRRLAAVLGRDPGGAEAGALDDEELRERLAAQLAEPAPWFQDRIVLVGPTATGLGDVHEYPYGLVAGPHVHAVAVAQLLRGDLLLEPPCAPLAELLLAFLWCAGLGSLAYHARGWVQAATVPLSLSVPLAAGAVLLPAAQVLVVPLGLSTAGGMAALGGVLGALAAARAAREEIRATFGRFLSPAVVEELAARPERARPGGELREITLLTSDIRGFTSLSESLDPSSVTDFLNRYFDAMVEVLWESGATVDKFMGDGLLAFYNAPLRQPDHALRGVRAALSLVARAERLSEELRRRGAPGAGFRIGVAVNTGTCLVGNVGATRAMGYTAIGDPVNTAARIEGLNSSLGTAVLVGESTVEATRGELPELRYRLVGPQQLKGKQRATRIYTVTSTEVRPDRLRRIRRLPARTHREAA